MKRQILINIVYFYIDIQGVHELRQQTFEPLFKKLTREIGIAIRIW